MSKLVTVFGGSGFVGRYIVQRLAHQGWRVRVACRRPNEAGFLRTYGVVGQVEPVFCNIRDDNSVRLVTIGSDAVVNCVGTFDARGKNNFDAVQNEGAGRIARIAAEEGVSRMVHLSALGADAEGESTYARSKAAGEEAVLAAMPGAMILRPSVIFGAEDQFFNRFAGMAKMGPVVPLVGGQTLFQPVYVDDVAAAAEKGAIGQAPGGIYELGGPHEATLAECVREMLGVIQRRRLVLNMPGFVGTLIGGGLDFLSGVSLGLFSNSVLTRDQVRQLKTDNVVSGTQMGFEDLGIAPVAAETVLPDYLWPHRPSGQYAAIKASARNLKI
ncbi:complex I NDUFA9 subunit family protein [Pseudooceanicola algae]|uniref:NAD-dependent epimerase/dehydratase domain-containing protein n=1 Tax=Pseudooceanicola algae TaxID=1537215 RepID=A0A418SFW8_9RHOB|nr:complex I NDUFA9 subunit family protein [Pseudooceanicola algae]QPM91564.1 hypothetical protein PSAL_028190 [Pseudooceanicola algae]